MNSSLACQQEMLSFAQSHLSLCPGRLFLLHVWYPGDAQVSLPEPSACCCQGDPAVLEVWEVPDPCTEQHGEDGEEMVLGLFVSQQQSEKLEWVYSMVASVKVLWDLQNLH